jgi:hypothetical protein
MVFVRNTTQISPSIVRRQMVFGISNCEMDCIIRNQRLNCTLLSPTSSDYNQQYASWDEMITKYTKDRDAQNVKKKRDPRDAENSVLYKL